MAKGSMWWGNATGKVGQTVLSVVNGQQITRAYQPNVTNPKTPSQMAQRALFACPVVFYKHGMQNLFKFAFSDKKPTESDFNAFMRENGKKSVLLTREQFLNPNVPKIGNYRLSTGSLPAPGFSSFPHDDTPTLMVKIITEDIVGGPTDPLTIGTMSKALLRTYKTLANGDIFTMIFLSTDAEFSDSVPYITPGTSAPSWEIYQFRLDVTSLDELDSEFFDALNEPQDEIGLIGRNGLAAVSVIMSRNVPGGLLVSTSDLHNASSIENCIKFMNPMGEFYDYEWYKQVTNSWGAGQQAILEGSLIE